MKTSKLPLFVDSDNAMGSPFGDVDDGFALAALFKSGLPLLALSSVFGNTFEPLAFRNHQRLASLCGYSGKVLRGAGTWWASDSESARFLVGIRQPITILALGPLTNVALALHQDPTLAQRIERVTFVATHWAKPNRVSRFTDFNHWKDPKALRAVVKSSIPLTGVPLDVAKRFQVTRSQLAEIEDPLGEYLRRHSRRWFWRARVLKSSRSFPIWDLVAVLATINPSLFVFTESSVELDESGTMRYGRGNRLVKLVTDYDPSECWKYFLRLLQSNHL